jgi:26S proteasome regulatory subunit N9
MNFLETQVLEHADLAGEYAAFGDLYSRKLWHQLTGKIEDFIKDPKNSRGDNFLRVSTLHYIEM